MRKSWPNFSSKMVVVGLLLSTVLFFGLSSPSSATKKVMDDSLLCQHGGDGVTNYIVVGPSVLDDINPYVISDDNPYNISDDPCKFFLTQGLGVFRSVGECGNEDARSLCAEYGKRITSDDLPWWDGSGYEMDSRDLECDFLFVGLGVDQEYNDQFEAIVPAGENGEGNCMPLKKVYEN